MDIPTQNPSVSRSYRLDCFDKALAVKQLYDRGMSSDRIAKAVQAIPDGMPYVYSCQTGEPIVVVLLYLLQAYTKQKARADNTKSLDGSRARAYDLCDFFEHLDVFGRPYTEIDQPVVDQYVLNLGAAINERTGRPITRSTIIRRLNTIASFTKSEGFLKIGKADFDMALAPVTTAASRQQIRAFTAEQWGKLTLRLGRLPSEAYAADRADHTDVSCEPLPVPELVETPSDEAEQNRIETLDKGPAWTVGRLVVEWAVRSGARRVELAHLDVETLRDIDLDDEMDDPDQTRIIELKVTKKRTSRKLWVPIDLLRETNLYMETERRAALEASGKADHGYVFVHPPSARAQDRGRVISRQWISRWFNSAVTATPGLVRKNVVPSKSSPDATAFTFHDCRHTYAVWTAVALREGGVGYPWTIVKSRLGHAMIDTTLNFYLAFIEEDEKAISHLLANYRRKWI